MDIRSSITVSIDEMQPMQVTLSTAVDAAVTRVMERVWELIG